MATPTRSTTGCHGHTHLVRVVMAVVLAGYGLALGASSSGNGYGPDDHLLAEQHEAIEAIEALSVGVNGDAHHHGEAYHEDMPAPTPPTVTLTRTLDKHVLASAAAIPTPPGARGPDAISPAAARTSVVLPVEERPPKRAA